MRKVKQFNVPCSCFSRVTMVWKKKKKYRTDDGTNEEKEGAEKRKGGKKS